MDETSFNWSLKDDIREYWGRRSETFDLSPGHEIFNDQERAGWHALFRRHLGEGEGRPVLDLASGTGVISHLLHDLGFQVTGLDFSDAMLARARAKAGQRKAAIHFIAGDAEQTLEADATYDAVVTRHLVWTLVNPTDAFAEWFRVLKPGGTLLIVDADTGAPRTLKAHVLRSAARLLAKLTPALPRPGMDMETHNRILKQVYFSDGARADRIADLLRAAGFQDVTIDRDLSTIHRGQWRNMPLRQQLERASQDRYAIRARKP
ncbi:class I SAM-dependent methyltransferase [Microvirga sp. 2YAF29]|uniref:class I SAM-dependent methyltransferase n=1 Tax=Microvirga sp. 2YAF29 TaxID=3233031 RepID=UPI003F9BA546